jgi:riboflavin synthase
MFTGIVEETGQVLAFEPKAEAWRLVVSARAALVDLVLGDSIAVNGCCLTATAFDAASLQFDVLEDSRRLTIFGALRTGA